MKQSKNFLALSLIKGEKGGAAGVKRAKQMSLKARGNALKRKSMKILRSTGYSEVHPGGDFGVGLGVGHVTPGPKGRGPRRQAPKRPRRKAKNFVAGSLINGKGKSRAKRKIEKFTKSGKRRNEKLLVWRGLIPKTRSGLTKADISKVSSSSGSRYVSKRKSSAGKNNPWIKAVAKARATFSDAELREMSPNGTTFVPVKKGSPIYKLAMQLKTRN